MDDTHAAHAPMTPAERRRLARLAVPLVAVAVIATIGDALSPTLVVEAPLLLVALVPRNRVLVLAAPQLAFVPFFAVAMARLVLTDPLFYLLGLRHGETAIRWVERRSGAASSVRVLERWFRRAAYPVLAVAPNNLICVLAGAAKMPLGWFLVTNLGGTALRLVLIWWVGDVFSDTLLDVVDFLGRYQWWFTGASILVVAVSVWWSRRQGRSPIETIPEIEHELEEFEGGTEDRT